MKRIVEKILALALVLLSIEILVRRLAWGQVPPEAPLWLVLAALLLNGSAAARTFLPAKAWGARKKNGTY